MEFIDLRTQYLRLKQTIDAGIHAVLEHGQYIMGPEVAELERQLATFTGSDACVACSSGTDALLIAMMALGIGSGDEVITTPFSFVATVETIVLLGAKPVFVDIDPKTYNMDPRCLRRAITAKTRAIMPVSLYGQCAEMEAINALALEFGVPVIEDAAQSFGATYQQRRSCNLSTIGCTSFFPSKPLGCYGDGGACFTNDKDLAMRMRQIRVHGQDRRYHHIRVGINGRMDTLQAAILIAKLPTFADELDARCQAAATYRELLKDIVDAPYIAPQSTSVYAQYTIEVENRSVFQELLKADGIPTAVHYPTPFHLQPAFLSGDSGPGSFPVAEAAAARVVSLPMHPFLSLADQQQIARSISFALSGVLTSS